MQHGIVPSIAGSHSAAAIGPFGIYFLELSIDADGVPTQSEGEVDHMHTEVAHDPNFSTRPNLPFPVNRF